MLEECVSFEVKGISQYKAWLKNVLHVLKLRIIIYRRKCDWNLRAKNITFRAYQSLTMWCIALVLCLPIIMMLKLFKKKSIAFFIFVSCPNLGLFREIPQWHINSTGQWYWSDMNEMVLNVICLPNPKMLNEPNPLSLVQVTFRVIALRIIPVSLIRSENSLVWRR